jgi:hypothetical protein
MSIDFEQERIEKKKASPMTCECGGEFIENSDLLSNLDEYGNENRVETVTFECTKCGAIETVERVSAQQEMEDQFEKYVPNGEMENADDGRKAPFSVPYKQLLDIFNAYEKDEIELHQALWLILEGEAYIEKKIEFLERGNQEGEDLPEINKMLIQGLLLVGEGYEHLGEFIATKRKSEWDKIAKEGELLIFQASEKLSALGRQ